MILLSILLATNCFAAERVTLNFRFKGMDEAIKIDRITDLESHIEKTPLISLETLTPMELMNVLTETNNVLNTFRPLSVRWDMWSTTLRLWQTPPAPGEIHKQYTAQEFIVYPSMTSVVHPRIIRNMRPRNYRKLNEWADRMLQIHSIENLLKWFDGIKFNDGVIDFVDKNSELPEGSTPILK